MPASIGVNLRVTGHCSQGGRKYMEDLFSVAYQQTEDERDLEYAFFGIYDGHGGSEAAAYAKEHLMDSIVKQRQFWSDNDEDVLKAIRNGYMLTHLNMWKELEKWPKTVTGLPSTAGTTASVAFIRRGKIYIGHVGDSAIVLGYQKDDCEEWAAKPLTSDHKPECTIEMERIQRCGGKVISKAGVPRVVWNRPRPGHKGPIKRNTPMDEIPFLAVARSLGDLWSYNTQNDEFIVSPDPDVGVLSIDPSRFRCLIFGTDGLWNMISPEGAVSLVQATERHNEAALVGGNSNQPRDWLNPSKSLVDHALERWSNTRMRADNTSVVTLMLDPPGPPRATVLRSKTAQKPQSTMPLVTPSLADDTPLTPPKIEETKPEVTDTEGRQMPQNGLTIMTRYMDAEKPTPLPDTPEKTPLPPCATLDGRFSIGSRDESRRETDESDEIDATCNYGNPAESYFMARLLNRSRVVNTLSAVYDEIMCGQNSRARSELREVASPIVTVVPEAQPVPDTGIERETIESAVPPPEERHERDIGRGDVQDAGTQIQINEVSSSSPTEAPKARGRRSRNEPRRDRAAVPDRVLRSHDNEANRPHTRQTVRPAPLPPSPAPHLDRVVILTRRTPVALSPAVMRVERPSTIDDRQPRRPPPDPPLDDSDGPRRATRSQHAPAPTSVPAPIVHKITRGLGTVARELRGAAAAAAGTRAGNSARAPGPARRAPAARREARSKENLGGVRRRTRAHDELASPPARHPPSPPRPRLARRTDSGRDDPEVHSTTGESSCLGPVPPPLRPRALRSRNDAEVAGSVVGGKRLRCEETTSVAGKTAKMSLERCSRSLGKRASGPWAPALALRNRLRKRLAK